MTYLAEGQSNKFLPPLLEGTALLARARLQFLLARVDGKEFRAALIEAQAGQGKTVCVAQYLTNAGLPHCWYQLGPEDGDHLLLARDLISAVRLQVNGFAPVKLEAMLRHGEFGPEQVDRIAGLLLEALEKIHLICVFDDVHHLAGSPQSERLLACLLQGASVSLRFILISRHALPKLISESLPARHFLRLSNADLAFNHHEIAELFNSVISRPLTLGAVAELHRLTEGWSMGLRLLGLGLPEESAGNRQERLAALNLKGNGILDYFMREVFSTYPSATRETLLRLSLLERIPIPLAKLLLTANQTAPDLKNFLTENLFIRFLEGENDILVFHHLFHEALRGRALTHFSPEEIKAVITAAANWHYQAGQKDEALHYYLAADNFEKAEVTLREIGFDLMASNRLVTLADILAKVPSDIEGHPWFGYFRGLLHLNTAPPLALGEFERARRTFEKTGDATGELLCLIESIAFHVFVDGAFNTGGPLLDRAKGLFPAAAIQLHPRYHLHAASILAIALIFIHSDFAEAQHFNRISARLAEQVGTANGHALSLTGSLSAAIFSNDFSRSAALAEAAAPILRDQRLSPYWQMVMQVMLCDYLYISGQFDSYRHHSQMIREAGSAELALRTGAGPIMRMWDIDIAFSCGDMDRARELLAIALAQNEYGLTSHIRSQYLAYKAIVDATDGRRSALLDADEAWQLRQGCGGAYHINECMVATATVYALLGEQKQAGDLLAQAKTLADSRGQNFLLLPTLACQAWLAIEIGDAATADAKVREFMARQSNYGSVHFFSWHQKIIRAVLSRAVQLDCEVKLARSLAARRFASAIEKDGTWTPLLTFRTLGDLRLDLVTAALCSGEIGQQHRTLLAMLISSRNHQLNAGRVQCEFWPENEESKARVKFDVMLLRLRRLFEDNFGVDAGKRYLLQKKGVLSLTNCQFDVDLFRELAEAGLRHFERGEMWRAENKFRQATELWEGDYCANETTSYEIDAIREGLHEIFRRMTSTWVKLLLARGDIVPMVAIAERAFIIFPTDAELVRALYQANILNGAPLKAQKVLAKYRSALMSSGYDHSEADDAVNELWEV